MHNTKWNVTFYRLLLYLQVYTCTCTCIYLSMYMYMYMYLYIYLHVHVSIYLSTCTCIYLSIYMYMCLYIYLHVQYLTKIAYVSRATRAICTAKYCVIVGGTHAVGIRAHALFCACVIQENGCKFVANTPRIL